MTSNEDQDGAIARGARDDPWTRLRRFTPARIALGRAGGSLPTRALLEFGAAHAGARDAVHHPLDAGPLLEGLAARGLGQLSVASAAGDRPTYLCRPDLGRRLDQDSSASLEAWRAASDGDPPDLVLVLADGLSALAIERHALPLIDALLPVLGDLRLGPVAVARQARVALGDEVGALLAARQVVVLIGERPGLSSPDSLGLYLTHAPRPGRTDAERNCISNVRPEGLAYVDAARRLAFLIRGARELGVSGIALKDDSATLPVGQVGSDGDPAKPAD